MASLQVRSIQIFCDVAAFRSFSQAARRHGITQSAASQTVQHLEDYLGVRLIDRSKRPLLLTQEGERFCDGARTIVRQFEALVEETRCGGAVISGHISVAAIYSIGLSYLPPVSDLFTARYPQASLSLQYAHPNEVYRLVEQGAVDVGLVSYPASSPTLQATPWREEPMVLVSSPRHRLAGSSQPIDQQQLEQVGLVAFGRELRIRQEIDRFLRQRGLSMRVVVELDNIDSVKHAVMVNSGVAILPEPTVRRELSNGSLRQLDWPGMDLRRPLGWIERRSLPLSRAARALIELLKQDVLPVADGVGCTAGAAEAVHEAVEREPLLASPLAAEPAISDRIG